jgi:hypothetical protein
MTETDNNPVETLIADLQAATQRLKDAPLKTTSDVQRELTLNVYPCMIAVAEQLAEVDGVIQEIVEQQETYLRPEFAALVFAVLGAGAALVETAEKMPQDLLDDVSRHRLQEAIMAWSAISSQLQQALEDALGDTQEAEAPSNEHQSDDSEEMETDA